MGLTDALEGPWGDKKEMQSWLTPLPVCFAKRQAGQLMKSNKNWQFILLFFADMQDCETGSR